MRNKNWKLGALTIMGLTLSTLACSEVQAGGCFSTTPQGDCVSWDRSEPVVWNPEGGDLKSEAEGGDSGDGGGSCSLISKAEAATIDNSQAVQIIQDAFDTWANVPFSGLIIQKGALLADGGDVNLTNIENFWRGQFYTGEPTNVDAAGCYDNDPKTPCINPIIFDQDGLITQAINGQCQQFGILGFAAILPQTDNDPPQMTISSPILKSAEAVVSGACIEPGQLDPNCPKSRCPEGITIDTIRSTMTHELGHFLGMDHTLVNKEEYLQCNAPGGCSKEALENIPTMIGLYVPGADLTTLHQDDKSNFAKIYPDTNPGANAFAPNTCSISGFATLSEDSSGRCLEIIARDADVNKSRENAAASMAGEFSPRFTQGNANPELADVLSPEEKKTVKNCTGSAKECSAFKIEGLKPGKYKININTFATPNGVNFSAWVQEPCTPPVGGPNIKDNLDATNDDRPGKNTLGDVTCTANKNTDIGQIWAR